MNKQYENNESVRNSIIGLGENSIRKSYYPQLKKKIEEVEELNRTLEEKIKERTKELFDQKNVFETLFNESSDPVLLIKNGHFIDCNNSALKTLKFDKKEKLLNLKPHQISPKFQPDGSKSIEKEEFLIEDCLKRGKNQFQWVHIKANQEQFWVDVSLTKIFLDNEIILHVSWRDITDKKILEEELKRRNSELEVSNEELQTTINYLEETQEKLVESEKLASLGSLVAGVAHEINTPIGIGLTGTTHFENITKEIKKLYEEDNMSQEEFENYLKTSTEIATLVNLNLKKTADLVKSFKQISIDQSSENQREFYLKEYLEEVLLSLRNITKKTNLSITIHCDSSLKINSYPGYFSQIFTNLIINSIKHGYKEMEKGTIEISIFKENSQLIIIYKDDGKGIEKEHLHKIFDPFFTTNREAGGSGLGLNIVYNIVRNRLNGTIECQSDFGEGVEFRLSIVLL